ncbi:aminoimidazole riboside kinase [Volucribacter amazonae]|uniref:Fructokinase n=1 Tax=Volucribacter amazonae TaxID=256731 RepID=A0A9X4PDD1_9PAST|nr:aminoimidazole riboside kinase [Volucribacter amazonae]MDG6896227.1 fructokinase [Volucribacter amazonae]
MNKIWVTGDAVVDLIPDGEQHYLKCAGGAPANVAVGVSRLGCQSAFIGRVGKDPLGEFMRNTLKAEKVNTEHLILDPQQRTSTVIVGLDNGERSFTFMVNPSADQFLQVADLPNFQANEWLHCCSIALINNPSREATFEAIRRIKSVGGFFSFDPNLRESLWSSFEEMKNVVNQAIALADVIKLSEEELTLLTDTDNLQEGFNKIIALHPEKLIIITLGKEGALYHINGQQNTIKGKAIQPIDTTGAGDAFVGGLLAGLSQHQDWQKMDTLEKIIRQANACGALATTAKGAMSALPNQQQLATYLAQ